MQAWHKQLLIDWLFMSEETFHFRINLFLRIIQSCSDECCYVLNVTHWSVAYIRETLVRKLVCKRNVFKKGHMSMSTLWQSQIATAEGIGEIFSLFIQIVFVVLTPILIQFPGLG